MATQWSTYRRTLKDAYKPRPPIEYIVDGIFALPSLNILYGSPGCLKSLLAADLAVCVAGGTDWLPPLPGAQGGGTKSFPVPQKNVTWIDFDNGEHRTSNRFEAIGRARNIPGKVGLSYYSMAIPWLAANDTKQIYNLITLINSEQAKLVVIDNLATISGGNDENSHEMIQVMSNLRLVSETTGAALVIIHHSRKETGYKGRSGDNLRGFSGIRGAIDTGLFVDRESGTDSLTIKSEKTRDADIKPFGAMFTYQPKPGTTELETCKFFGVSLALTGSNADIETEIVKILSSQPGTVFTQTALTTKVSQNLGVGFNRVRQIIINLASRNEINVRQGKRGSFEYYV